MKKQAYDFIMEQGLTLPEILVFATHTANSVRTIAQICRPIIRNKVPIKQDTFKYIARLFTSVITLPVCMIFQLLGA